MTRYTSQQLDKARWALKSAETAAHVLYWTGGKADNRYTKEALERQIDENFRTAAAALGYELAEPATRTIHDTAAAFCGQRRSG